MKSKLIKLGSTFAAIAFFVLLALGSGEDSDHSRESGPDSGTRVPSSQSTLVAGNVATIYVPNAKAVLLAVDETALTQLTKAANRKDYEWVASLLLKGKLFEVDQRAKVRVIESGFLKCKVEVISGKNSGETGWIAREFLRRKS